MGSDIGVGAKGGSPWSGGTIKISVQQVIYLYSLNSVTDKTFTLRLALKESVTKSKLSTFKK